LVYPPRVLFFNAFELGAVIENRISKYYFIFIQTYASVLAQEVFTK
jgi:hypothetical protein